MESHAVKEVPVLIPSAAYSVYIGEGLLETCGAWITRCLTACSCALVTDTNVGPLYAGTVQESLESSGIRVEPIVMPSGEASKSFAHIEALCDAMIEAGLDRHAFVVALGGGVIGDLAGFAAAIYYRGIPLVQIPTTVVAQVDSSVGGKTGINARGGKNLIGAFHQPAVVIADTKTLATLPKREYNEGFAEIIKHAVIRDAAMLGELGGSIGDLPALIRRNVAIKAAIVAADEKETTGERALLNFGHTIGHGIEQATGYGRLLHGEAISLGLVAALRLSVEKAGLPPADAERVIDLLHAFELPVTLDSSVNANAILDALRRDKKFASGQIRFVLTSQLGSAFVSRDVSLADIEHAVNALYR